MKRCSKCQHDNNSDNKFCSECGSAFDKGRVEANKTVKSNKLIIRLAACVLVVCIVAVSVLMIKTNPATKVVRGIGHYLGQEDMTGQMSVSMIAKNNQETRAFDLLNATNLIVDYKITDTATQSNIKMLVDSEPLLSSAVTYQDGNLYFGMKEYYDDVVYLDVNDMQNLMETIESYQVYLSEMDFSFMDQKRLMEILNYELSMEKNKNGQVVVKLDNESLVEVFEQILDDFEDNKAYVEGFYHEMTKVLKQMIRDDFVLTIGYSTYDKDDFQHVLDSFDDQDAFVSFIDENIFYLSGSFDFLVYIVEDFEIELVFDFDLLGNVKTLDSTIVTEDFDLFVDFDLKRKSDFEDFKPNKSVSLKDEASSVILDRIGQRVLKTLLYNDQFMAHMTTYVNDAYTPNDYTVEEVIELYTNSIIDDIKYRLY